MKHRLKVSHHTVRKIVTRRKKYIYVKSELGKMILSKSQKQDPNVTERLSPNDPDLENRCEKLRYLGNFARTGRVPPIQLGKGKVHNPTLPFS